MTFGNVFNFRDLGGYRSADGRTVRWGRLFRADDLCRLDDADLAELLTLAAESVVGGVVAVDGVSMFRHSIPLDDAATAGFDRSFHLVVDTADRLEEHVTGEDVH